MTIDAVEVIKTSIGSLRTDVGKKLIGVYFLLQLLNFAGTTLTKSSGMQSMGIAVTILSSLIGIIVTIGGLRAFREGKIKKKMFTEKVKWPYARILGAGLVSAISAYALAFVFLIPAITAGMLSGSLSSGLSGAGIVVTLLALLGIIGALGAFIFVTVSLMLTQPLIAINEMRMFQALDESIQRTKGDRLSIAGAFFGLIVLYLAVGVLTSLVGSLISQTASQAATALVVTPLLSPIGLKLIETISYRLEDGETEVSEDEDLDSNEESSEGEEE